MSRGYLFVTTNLTALYHKYNQHQGGPTGWGCLLYYHPDKLGGLLLRLHPQQVYAGP